MLSTPLILEGLLGISFKGNTPMMAIAAMLLIIGYLALGALMQLLVRDLATGLGLTGLIVSPAFGYAGVGFPILGMNAFALSWGAILPLRWYMAVLLGQAARGLPLYESARPFAVLAALAAIYTLLAFLRLRAIAASTPRTPREAEPAAAPAPSRGVGGAFVGEWRRVLAIRGAFMLLVVGPLVYGLYYPQPYLNQILRKIPIAVVDNDLSELSRNIVQTLDASGAVRVAVQAATLAEGREALDRGDAFAVVEIPPWTERDVLKGTTVHVPIFADATYLFIFRSMSNGIAVAIDTLSSELAARGARTDGSLVKAALASASPAEILLQPTRARALLHRAAPLLRLFHAGPSGATLRARVVVHARDQFHGTSGGRLVPTTGDPDAHLSRHEPSAAFRDGLFLAARSNPNARACCWLHIPFGFRDRRHRPYRPAGRKPW